eukprot:GHVU01133237.1.p1 GENE.GHVU01133237.1~~GHVU01133237.1.p1  ORF type:complete len:144 (+),score=25.88 GHVU01133237.1:1694-2125(+)
MHTELLPLPLAQRETERKDLERQLSAKVDTIRSRLAGRNLLLQKKITPLVDALSKQTEIIAELLSRESVDAGLARGVMDKIETVMKARDAKIEDLRYQVQRGTKGFNETIRLYENRLEEMGVPIEDTKFARATTDSDIHAPST